MLEKDLIETIENKYKVAESMIDYNIKRESDPVLLNYKIKFIKESFYNDMRKLLDNYHSDKEKEMEEYENYLYPEDDK